MHGLNTRVAKVQSTAMTHVCTATRSLLTGLGGNGGFSPETVSVLIFEMGQVRPSRDADDQTACAFCVGQSARFQPRFCCAANGLVHRAATNARFWVITERLDFYRPPSEADPFQSSADRAKRTIFRQFIGP